MIPAKIVDPRNVPVRGMNSSLNPWALPDGYFSQITNFRFGNRFLKTRDGISKLNSGLPIANATFKGAWVGYVDGALHIMACYRASGATGIYRFDPIAFGWGTISDSSATGQYGDTRFATDGDCSFAPFKLPGKTDALIIQNGTDAPRVWSPNTGAVAKHEAIVVPFNTSAMRAYLKCGNGGLGVPIWESGTRSALSYTNSSAQFALSDSGAKETLATKLNLSTTATTNDTATFNFTGATKDITGSRQIAFVVSTTWADAWSHIKIEIENGAGGGFVTVYDPASVQYDPVYITELTDLDPYLYLVAFQTDALDTSATQFSSWGKVRLTYTGPSNPTNAREIVFYAICGTGIIPGGMEYALTYENSASRAISPLIPIAQVEPETVKQLGGTPIYGLQMPNSPSLYYHPIIYYKNVVSTELQKGVDTVNIYRADYGEEQFTWVNYDTLTTWTPGAPGSWSTGTASTIIAKADTTVDKSPYSAMLAPDIYNKIVPIGNCMIVSNSRLYVGGVGTSRSDWYASEDGNPGRFRETVRFLDPSTPDPRSPVKGTFPSEVVQTFHQGIGAYIGVNPLFIWTNKSLYRIDGATSYSLSRPTWIGPHGTLAPWSVAEHAGTFFWLDSDRQVRQMSGGASSPISRYVVDDKLRTATVLRSAGAVLNERYFLGFSSGGGYLRALVYDIGIGGFSEDVLADGNWQQFITVDNTSDQTRKVYFFDIVGNVYRLETPSQTTDNGVAFTCTLTTREYGADGWGWTMFRRLGIIADDMASSSLTVSRTYKPSASGQSGTVNLDVSGSYSYLWEKSADTKPVGGQGVTCIISVTGALPGGKNIYEIVQEMEAMGDARAATSA